MTQLELLRNGSAFHQVKVLSANAITIVPVSRNEADILAFQEVVADAEAHSYEGYTVLPHVDNIQG
jgi:hypothetical protein